VEKNPSFPSAPGREEPCEQSERRDPETVRWHAIDNAVNYARFYSRSHDAVIRVYDEAANVIDTREHTGGFREANRLNLPGKHID
jgi:hypothetical protein